MSSIWGSKKELSLSLSLENKNRDSGQEYHHDIPNPGGARALNAVLVRQVVGRRSGDDDRVAFGAPSRSSPFCPAALHVDSQVIDRWWHTHRAFLAVRLGHGTARAVEIARVLVVHEGLAVCATSDVLRAVQMSLVRAVGARPAMAVLNVADGPPVQIGGNWTGA